MVAWIWDIVWQSGASVRVWKASLLTLQLLRGTDHMLPFLRSFKPQSLNIVSRCHQSVRLSGPHKMHRKVTIDTSPPPARWMKDTLVRSAFHRTVPVVAVRLPAANAGIVLKAQPMRG